MTHRKVSNTGRRKADPTPQTKKRRIKLGLVGFAVMLAGGVGGYGFLHGHTAPLPTTLTVKTPPPKLAEGFKISIKNSTNPPQLCETPFSEDRSVALKAGCQVKPVMTIPIIGSCPKNSDGSIGAPTNWNQGCEYRPKTVSGKETGAVAYLGHSVADREITSIFEKLVLLKPGDVVNVEGTDYSVAHVTKFPKTGLPSRLFQEGHLSIITCAEDGALTTTGNAANNIVVELTDVAEGQ